MVDQIDNRRLILDVAQQLIIEKGIDETSLADIARKANISKGTLYYYYASKDNLIFDIAEEHIDRVTADLTDWVDRSAPEHTPQELLQNVLEIVLSAELRGKLHLYLVERAITSDPALRGRFQLKYRSWKEMIEKRLEAILKDEQDYADLASIIIAVLDGLLVQSLLGVNQVDLNTVARRLVSRDL